jgi:DNA-binding transcriptional LysR family regulator
MNHLNPQWLASFVAIAETGTLASAARRMHRTASALSVQLQQLESTLATQLVERTTRSLRLTSSGERFLPHARRLLEMEQTAMAAVQPNASAQQVVRIGLTEYLMPGRLHELLELLRHQTDGARLEVVWGRSAELLQRWAATTLDLVVFTSSSPPANSVAIVREPLCWVAGDTFDAAASSPVPLVLLSDQCPVRDLALASMARRARTHEIRLECSGSQAVITAVKAGWGVGCLNRSAVPGELRDLSRFDRARWPSPGWLAFHSLAQPSWRGLSRAVRAWAR